MRGTMLELFSDFDQEQLYRLLVRFGYIGPEDETAIPPPAREMALTSGLERFQAFCGEPDDRLPAAARERLMAARCSIPDIGNESRFPTLNSSDARWPGKQITYAIHQNGIPRGLTPAEVQSAFEKGIRMWTDHIDFDIVQGASNAQVQVRFAAGVHGPSPDLRFDLAGGLIGHGFGPPRRDLGSLAGDVHFDAAETWVVSGVRGTDLATAAAHELGHVLGFNHQRPITSIMYSTYGGPRTHISNEDRIMAQNRYGARNS